MPVSRIVIVHLGRPVVQMPHVDHIATVALVRTIPTVLQASAATLLQAIVRQIA